MPNIDILLLKNQITRRWLQNDAIELKFILKMSTISSNIAWQTCTPLTNCFWNYPVIKICPFCYQPLLKYLTFLSDRLFPEAHYICYNPQCLDLANLLAKVLDELNLASFHWAVTVWKFRAYGILLVEEVVKINNK